MHKQKHNNIQNSHKLHVIFDPERYVRMKEIIESQSSQPSSFMHQLMKLSNKSQVLTPIIVSVFICLSYISYLQAVTGGVVVNEMNELLILIKYLLFIFDISVYFALFYLS